MGTAGPVAVPHRAGQRGAPAVSALVVQRDSKLSLELGLGQTLSLREWYPRAWEEGLAARCRAPQGLGGQVGGLPEASLEPGPGPRVGRTPGSSYPLLPPQGPLAGQGPRDMVEEGQGEALMSPAPCWAVLCAWERSRTRQSVSWGADIWALLF